MSTKRKLPSKLATPVVKHSARTPSKQIRAEARAVVGSGALDSPSLQLTAGSIPDTIDISSDAASDSSDNDEDAELSDKDEDATNFHAAAGDDTSMADADEDAPEPSFGDLVHANHSEPISVAAAFPTEAAPKASALALPTGASLGVALSQALKTSDHALLESCLQTSDLPTIRATIQRLAAPLSATLLVLLAGRLHRRPGRAGSLMVWIQWTLVTHGGFLATQPQVVGRLAELNRVIEERARGLQSLLALKGKLDLLDAQMQLRRSMRDARRVEEDDEDEGVVYVEGAEEDSEADEAAAGAKVVKGKKLKRSARFEDSESEMSDEMPDTLGDRVIADSDEEEEDSDDDEGGLLDDEAEETDDDSGLDNGDDVDFDDADEDEEDSDADAAAATPARTSKMQKISGAFGRKH